MESLKFFKGQFMRKKQFDVIEQGSLFHSQPVKRSLFWNLTKEKKNTSGLCQSERPLAITRSRSKFKANCVSWPLSGIRTHVDKSNSREQWIRHNIGFTKLNNLVIIYSHRFSCTN